MSLTRPSLMEARYQSNRGEPTAHLLAAIDPILELSVELPRSVGHGEIRIKQLSDDFGAGELDILGAYDDCTLEFAQPTPVFIRSICRRRESTGENPRVLSENRCDDTIAAGEYVCVTPDTGSENDTVNPLPVNDVHVSSTQSMHMPVTVSINAVGLLNCAAPRRSRVVRTAGNEIPETLLAFRGAIVSCSREKARRYRPWPGVPRQGGLP